MKESDFILEATFDMVGARVAEEVERIHDENASNIKYNDENFLSSVLSLAYLLMLSNFVSK